MSNHYWEPLIAEIEKRINHESFNTWFKPVAFHSQEETTINLSVPNDYFQSWITENYSDIINESLEALNLGGYNVELIPKGATDTETSEEINNLIVGTESYENYVQEVGEDVGTVKVVDNEPSQLFLNSKYTFETFVVGSCNQFAHAAAQAVAETPFKTYNPLFIYGGVGLGKTHLMHAIGQAIRNRERHLQLAYISSEKFMNELIDAIRYDKAQSFRDKYRSIDVLLIDDIQFIAGKERTQEEFFHTFNALHNAQKQIVISSDCPPREIPSLEERLHSRFEWGLIADLQPPDLETKVAILKRKAEVERIDLLDSVAFFVAGKIKSNVRELEGSLIRLAAYASLKRRPIDIELCKEILNINEDDDERVITIELVQRAVADHYGLRISDLKEKNNAQNIAFPRQVAMYLCKRLTSSSFPEIGREFGNKHHTTVMHSCGKVNHLYETQKDFRESVDNLVRSLSSQDKKL